MRGYFGVAFRNGVVVAVLAGAWLVPTRTIQAQSTDCAVRAEAALDNGDRLSGRVEYQEGRTTGTVNHTMIDVGFTYTFSPSHIACTVSETEATARLVGSVRSDGEVRESEIEFLAGPERADGKRPGTYHISVSDPGGKGFDYESNVTIETSQQSSCNAYSSTCSDWKAPVHITQDSTQ
jgi:hypothetical protein